jgi:hypothetical protein
MHVPHRQDATYHHNYTGTFVGANREAPSPMMASSSSSSSSNASTPAPKSKGKGRAADRQ